MAVVRLPMAPSVPSTAMRGQVTSAMRPVNIRRSFLARGRRTSRICTSYARLASANSGSSFKNSCSPLTMSIPVAMASRTTARSWAESMPLDGAIPKMKASAAPPAWATASARSRHTGMSFGFSPSTTPASVPACWLSITATIS